MAKGLLQPVTWRSGTLVLLESSLIIAAVIAGSYVVLGSQAWRMDVGQGVLPKMLLVAYLCQLCLYYTDLYDDPRVGGDRRELLVRLLHALGATALILSVLYFWFPTLVIGRGVFAVAAMLVTAFVVGWRVAFAWFTRRIGPRERLLIVGRSPTGLDLARELYKREDLGIEIVGFVDPDPARIGEPVINPGVIGTIDDIPAIVRARRVDRVVVDLADARGKLPMGKLLEMRLDGIAFEHLTSLYEEYTGKIAVENLRPSWLIFSSGFCKTRALLAVKRGIDVIVAAVGLVCALPVLLVVAVLVKAGSKGPALYWQERVGQRGRLFKLYKIRTMRHDAEAGTGPVWAQPGDARVTGIGRQLRRTRLDELPQLWNVLVGDMSLVGPRPERPEFVSGLTRQVPFYGQRHVVKPGVTGWAQVRYAYGASVEDAMEKLQYDLFYIKNMSIALDLFIIFETFKAVVRRRGW
jgi:sugar transferase (PEP-CTERM system associated)